MQKKKWILGLLVVAAAALLLLGMAGGKEAPVRALPAAQSAHALEQSYQQYLDAHGYEGVLAQDAIAVDVFAYEADAGARAERGEQGVLTGDEGVVTWTLNAPSAGFYHIRLGYLALPGTTSDIQRRVLLDGKTPYSALSQVVLKRVWRDEEIRTKNGNEIRPNAEEVYQEQTVYLEDYNRRSGAPLIVYLSEGEHTFALEAMKEPVEITSITFAAQPDPVPYAQALAAWQAEGKVYAGAPIVCQAERRQGATLDVRKSSPSITVQKNYSDAALVPYHPWHILYPTIGADSWCQPGDCITWEVDAPEDGLYVLTFKGRQHVRGVTSYRRLLVNGELPFAEAAAVGFDHAGSMENYTLADANGAPYYIPLHKGSNTISLEVVLGSMGGVLSQVEESLTRLNSLYLRVIQITGQAPSIYIDYEIATKVPDFVPTMSEESQRLRALVEQVVAITGEKGETTALLEKMAIEAEGLALKPETVVEELTQLKNNVSALGTWIVSVSTMPLELDSLVLSADTASLPAPRDTFLQGAWAGVQRFVSTFFVKTSSTTSDAEGGSQRPLKVWMASAGREQAQMLQNMIDETFTPNTDIAVTVQLIPVDVVLRAALAGNGPDVVVGLSQATSQDFAMRGATVDLSRLEGFADYASRYGEGVMRCAAYQDGVYGIPEQVNFMMLFYRQDVVEALELPIPRTWTEIMEIIPILSRENYGFYLPSTRVPNGVNVFESMVFQNGGEIYEGEGTDYGIASALRSDEAMKAFKWYGDLFTVHALEVQVDFPNRFRTGEMPMGITDYTNYCMLEVFAPEIKGMWSFAPFAGTLQADGSVDNTYVCETVQSVIMQGARNKDAAWEFVKWWNTTDSQLSYANTLEAVMGTAARYPAADPNVLRQLPWSNAELKQLLSQYEHLRGLPAVPGYYMNTRMIGYAFEDVVADLSNPRETLFMNIRDIDAELTKKRQEFGISTAQREGQP